MPTIKTKKRMNKKEYAQFLIDNAEIIEITAGYRSEEKYDQNIKLEPLNNKTIPISKDILEVEIEEEITEDTVLPKILGIANDGCSGYATLHERTAINEVVRKSSIAFYFLNEDLSLTLIWTKEKGLVE
ncbi:hypothetical protein [Mammaliicoccus sciuri]|uniref:hypothetical protein n=1 Tax=Mammaliicoccus sciuri TaxID=1296 RepID=UPI003364B86A